MNHFFLMLLHALVIGLFFALLGVRPLAERARVFAKVFGGLVLGGLALAWLLYFFPAGPPAPLS